MKNIIIFIACTLGVLLIGSISGLANAGNITGWYSTLQKPSFNPPDYLFGPVWTVLYFLMGVSLFLIIKTPNTEQRTTALIIFGIQLFLNFIWSFLFFYFKLTGVAAIEIVLIWISIVFMIFTFYKLSPGAAYLQIPYFLWVSFASVLNISIWHLNI